MRFALVVLLAVVSVGLVSPGQDPPKQDPPKPPVVVEQTPPAVADKDAKPEEAPKTPQGAKAATGATGTTVRGEKGRVLPAQPGLPDDLNNQPEFKLGPGDSLSINVWKEPEVSTSVSIRGDCRITLPLIKDLEICGLTPTEVQNLLVEKFSKYLAAPDVTVTLGGMVSRKIYFIGNVKRPGGMVLLIPTTIAQALSDAGGLSDYANDKAVIIMRNDEHGKPMRYVFNYREYIRGKSQKGNILLQPGDTVIVH